MYVRKEVENLIMNLNEDQPVDGAKATKISSQPSVGVVYGCGIGRWHSRCGCEVVRRFDWRHDVIEQLAKGGDGEIRRSGVDCVCTRALLSCDRQLLLCAAQQCHQLQQTQRQCLAQCTREREVGTRRGRQRDGWGNSSGSGRGCGCTGSARQRRQRSQQLSMHQRRTSTKS